MAGGRACGRWHAGLTGLACALLLPAWAAAAVNSVVVRNGIVSFINCTPEQKAEGPGGISEPWPYNECLCKGDIVRAEVSGIAPKAAEAINAQLAELPQQLAEESCAGKTVISPPPELHINQVSAHYEVTYETPQVLSLVVTYTTYGAAAAHPITGSEGFNFDLGSGRLLVPVAQMNAATLTKANAALRQAIEEKFGAQLREDVKSRTEPFLTAEGCDACTMFYANDGWHVRFQVYAIASYADGEPTFVLPTSVIPSPEALIAKR